MSIAFISITIDSINERFPCTQRSAQENVHAATISRLAMNVKRKDILKILQPTDKRSLLIHKNSNATLCKHFARR